MDERALKEYLLQIARTQGTRGLTQDEVDYMKGHTSYVTYQQHCYAQYRRGNLIKRPKGGNS